MKGLECFEKWKLGAVISTISNIQPSNKSNYLPFDLFSLKGQKISETDYLVFAYFLQKYLHISVLKARAELGKYFDLMLKDMLKR